MKKLKTAESQSHKVVINVLDPENQRLVGKIKDFHFENQCDTTMWTRAVQESVIAVRELKQKLKGSLQSQLDGVLMGQTHEGMFL